MKERTQIIDNIRQVASRVLPKGSTLYLYGSRARGDAHDVSDWDLLLLLNNEGDSDEISWARELAERLGVENDFKHISEREF